MNGSKDQDWMEHKKMILAEIKTAKEERVRFIQNYNELGVEVADIKVKVGKIKAGIYAIIIVNIIVVLLVYC